MLEAEIVRVAGTVVAAAGVLEAEEADVAAAAVDEVAEDATAVIAVEAEDGTSLLAADQRGSRR